MQEIWEGPQFPSSLGQRNRIVHTISHIVYGHIESGHLSTTYLVVVFDFQESHLKGKCLLSAELTI